LKAELKALNAEEVAKEAGRLKAEVVVLSDASSKLARLEEEAAIDKTTVKDLRLKVSKGTTGYAKLFGKYNQLKKDAKREETSLKKEISTLKADATDKEKKQKQDEAAVAAGKEARKNHEFKLKCKLEAEEEKLEKKTRQLETKEQLRKDAL
jgi:hypothetical protein